MNEYIKRLIMHVLTGFGIFLLIIAVTLEALPLTRGSALNTFHLAARQRVLEQRITVDALTLTYRPANEHAEALVELQAALPVWEQVQKGLQNGDNSLGISPNLPDNVKSILLTMQPDYTYMDIAARQILAHHAPVGLDELSIIMQDEQPYYLLMGEAVQTFQDDIDAVAKVYFGIELAISIALASIFIVLVTSRSKERRTRETF